MHGRTESDGREEGSLWTNMRQSLHHGYNPLTFGDLITSAQVRVASPTVLFRTDVLLSLAWLLGHQDSCRRQVLQMAAQAVPLVPTV